MLKPFAVEVNGRGYLLEFEPGSPPQKAGFYTCYGVKARSVEAAVEKATERVRRSARLNEMIRNAPDDSPMIYTEAVYELDDGADVAEWDRGFVFYNESDEPEEAA